MDEQAKMDALDSIMRSAHALAELAWPSGDGKLMPADALTELIDIQIAACKALGLPDDMDLRTGDPTIDGITSPPRS
jgi:hypothetical protein